MLTFLGTFSSSSFPLNVVWTSLVAIKALYKMFHHSLFTFLILGGQIFHMNNLSYWATWYSLGLIYIFLLQCICFKLPLPFLMKWSRIWGAISSLASWLSLTQDMMSLLLQLPLLQHKSRSLTCTGIFHMQNFLKGYGRNKGSAFGKYS